MSDPFTTVSLVAAELRIVARPQFDAFLAAIVTLEERVKTDLVAADTNTIFHVQGRAQLVAQLRRTLENCMETREKIMRR